MCMTGIRIGFSSGRARGPGVLENKKKATIDYRIDSYESMHPQARSFICQPLHVVCCLVSLTRNGMKQHVSTRTMPTAPTLVAAGLYQTSFTHGSSWVWVLPRFFASHTRSSYRVRNLMAPFGPPRPPRPHLGCRCAAERHIPTRKGEQQHESAGRGRSHCMVPKSEILIQPSPS